MKVLQSEMKSINTVYETLSTIDDTELLDALIESQKF
jgi:hypothetical protein